MFSLYFFTEFTDLWKTAVYMYFQFLEPNNNPHKGNIKLNEKADRLTQKYMTNK